jgi:hypothetical protein
VSACVKFHSFVPKLWAGVFSGVLTDADALMVYLSDVEPDAATMSVKADLAEIAPGNGYPLGGVGVRNRSTVGGGVIAVEGECVVVEAIGGPIGPFRYVVLYDDTVEGDPLIGWWDRHDEVTLREGDSVKVDCGGVILEGQ